MTNDKFIPESLMNANKPVFADYRDYADAVRAWREQHGELEQDEQDLFYTAGYILNAGYHVSEACSYYEEDRAIRAYFAFASTLLALRDEGIDFPAMFADILKSLEAAAPQKDE